MPYALPSPDGVAIFDSETSGAVAIDGALPAREWRDAWRLVGNRVAIDMEAARDIWRGKLREARSPRMAQLDVLFNQAVEARDLVAQQQIGARRQMLRDITHDPRIDAAQTPDELKAVWPFHDIALTDVPIAPAPTGEAPAAVPADVWGVVEQLTNHIVAQKERTDALEARLRSAEAALASIGQVAREEAAS